MNFVGGIGIPDDQFSILRGGDEMTAVRRPVHGVDLSKVTLQRAAWLHADSREGFGLVLRDLSHYKRDVSIVLLKSHNFNQSPHLRASNPIGFFRKIVPERKTEGRKPKVKLIRRDIWMRRKEGRAEIEEVRTGGVG